MTSLAWHEWLVPALVIGIVYFYTREERFDQLVDDQLNSTYDYIIVGSGSAGAVIANRLTEDDDVTVLLLEAGGSELDNVNIRVPLNVGYLQMSNEDWLYHTVPQKTSSKAMNNRQSYWAKGRVLGGTSCLNYMAYIRGSRHDYDQWEAEGCSGWGYKDVLPYFQKIEDIQIPSLYDSPYHSRGGYLPISEIRVSPLSDIFSKAASELELKEGDMNGKEMLGFSRMQANIKDGERQSTAKSYIRPIIKRHNLHISLNTIATKILIEDKKAVGVQVIKNNRKSTIAVNKEVILSAGSVNSPQLLMLSGIGPKNHLQEHGIPVVSDLPVGDNLQDHMMFFMRYKINQSDFVVHSKSAQTLSNYLNYKIFGAGWNAFAGAEANIFGQRSNRGSNIPEYPDYQIILYSVAQDADMIEYGMKFNLKQEVIEKLKTRGSKNEFTLVCILLHPKSKGTIRLKSRDPFDYPNIDPKYLEHPDDIKSLISAIRTTQRIASTQTLKNLGASLIRMDFDGICNKETFDSDKYWECLLRYFAYTIYHPVSTCRMGSVNDSTAVVDPELRVKGIKGLRVADASVMRAPPSGNTNAPSIMIGEKASDLIRGKNTVLELRQNNDRLNL